MQTRTVVPRGPGRNVTSPLCGEKASWQDQVRRRFGTCSTMFDSKLCLPMGVWTVQCDRPPPRSSSERTSGDNEASFSSSLVK